MARKNSSSKRWLKEHRDDIYVRRAVEQGYRSRACFKLLEIQEKDRIIKPGMTVLDLGAAPGGWSQVAVQLLGKRNSVIASDILAMEPIEGVQFVQGDFTEQAVFDELLEVINNRPIDLVICDMAPNMSGMAAVDQPASMYLAELALDMAVKVLRPGGAFLCKVFQGEGFDHYLGELRNYFDSVVTRKPAASRPRSKESYQLARGLTVRKT